MAYQGNKMLMYLAREAQIASMITEKINVQSKYSDFIDIFFLEKVSVRLQSTLILTTTWLIWNQVNNYPADWSTAWDR